MTTRSTHPDRRITRWGGRLEELPEAHPLSVLSVDATLTFDGGNGTVHGSARVIAKVATNGAPYFDLYVPDGATPQVRDHEVVRAVVDDASTAWALPGLTGVAGREVELQIDWTLPRWTEIVFTDRVAAFKLRFSDRSAGGFLERYLPAPCDWVRPFALKLTLATTGGTSFGPHVYTNGKVSSRAPLTIAWAAVRPGDPYLHVESAAVKERGALEGNVVVYSSDANADLDRAVAIVEQDLALLEADFGPMPGSGPILVHLVAYQGGMEYRRALVANLGNLRHELVHLWFGRGRWPRDADSAWLDEAVATWWAYDREWHGRRRAREPVAPTPAQVGGLRARRRSRRTPPAAYFAGLGLLHATAELLGTDELKRLLAAFLGRGAGAYVATDLANDVLAALDRGAPAPLRECWELLAAEEPSPLREQLRPEGAHAGAGARAELWDGPIGIRPPDSEHEFVGYRTTIDVGPNQGTFEYWAMLSDSFLNTSTTEKPLWVKRLDDVTDFPPGLSEVQFRVRALAWLNDDGGWGGTLTADDLRFEKLKLL